ncbi:hypothetical protein SCLCIDRAFT_30327 [Scleroderma citrinum Foug A]|uniref:Uncharacterized protein n=1 Tax=Scleroderma citrinum Foug A TaxID=1036808 RepID=A0A0C2Z0W7_9AGAM|nr:hypothetical protein SCLCIDRAFT_30327 [Scleroderma citrinum Foug A]
MSKCAPQISGFLPNWKPDVCHSSMQSKPASANSSKRPTLNTTHSQPALTLQPYGGLTDQANSDSDDHVQSDESYEVPPPLRYNPPYSSSPMIQISQHSNAHGQPDQDKEMMGQDNEARGNGYKHGDGEEDGGSDMGARRPSSKAAPPRSLVHKAGIETHAPGQGAAQGALTIPA